MKITLQQLPQLASKSLAAVYLIGGEEILLVEEAMQIIRDAAQKQGFTERERILADSGEWTQSLHIAAHSLSLFSNKRLLELDLTNAKLTAASSKILQEYANHPAPDTLLIVRIQKIDSKIEQSAWYKTFEKHIVVPIWPVTPQQLPAWIIQRAKKIDLSFTQRAAELLAKYCEGNLLAAAQEIEKIKLLNAHSSTVDENLLTEFATDNAHFDIFTLVESALAANSERSLRILNHLQAEGIEPVLVLWAFTNELRLLNTLTKQTQKGMPLPTLFKQYRIWEKRQGPIQHFLRRATQKTCWKLLVMAAEIDRMIKGTEPGNTWDALEKLALSMGAIK